MDQQLTTESLTQPCIGEALRESRASQKLSVEDVCARLHLSERQIIALETDDFKVFGSSMLARGFIKTYANFLSLNPEPLLIAYRQLFPQDQIQSIEYQSADIARPQSTSLNKLLSLIVSLLIVLALIAWVSYKVWIYQETTNVETVMEPVIDIDQGSSPVTSQDNPLASTEQQSTTSSIVTEVELPKVNEPKVNEIVKPQVVAADSKTSPEHLQETNLATVTKAELANAVSKKAPVSISGAIKVRLVLTGSSWIGVQDKTGRTVFSKLAKAGSEEFVEGVPPLKFHIGNASATQVIFNGEVVDLTASTFNNMARITLGD